MSLPAIPLCDYRREGMLAYVRDRADGARHLLETVLRGLGPVGRVGRPLLSSADRLAANRLAALSDPYRDEILAIREIVGKPGPVAFSLSYEFGCTARIFAGAAGPTLFRSLDWPFRGLGELVEMVILPGQAGDWITATWPGVVGALHGAAPGRFAAALNQAPERASRYGRAASWVDTKRRFLRAEGLPPPHLLRLVFEQAPDYATARAMLTETPVAAPVIFSLCGPGAGEQAVIERTEDSAADVDAPAAANHFASRIGTEGRWRARGHDSLGRRAAALTLDGPPPLDGLSPPILNPLTRLAVMVDPAGALNVVGYDGDGPVTQPGHARLAAA